MAPSSPTGLQGWGPQQGANPGAITTRILLPLASSPPPALPHNNQHFISTRLQTEPFFFYNIMLI